VSLVRRLPRLWLRLAWGHPVEVRSTPESISPERWAIVAEVLPVQARWTRASINRERLGIEALAPVVDSLGRLPENSVSRGKWLRQRSSSELARYRKTDRHAEGP